MNKQNATHFFEAQSKNFHNCEAWWTAYLSLILLYKTSENCALRIPVYEACQRGYPHVKPGEHGVLELVDLSFENVIVDGSLKGHIFDQDIFPDDFKYLRPDVSILFKEKKEVTFIEVKTIRGRLEGQLDKYSRLVDYLNTLDTPESPETLDNNANKWKAEIYYLLSRGYRPNSEWGVLAEKKAKIILWEDVLRMAFDTPLKKVFDEATIAKYLTQVDSTDECDCQ